MDRVSISESELKKIIKKSIGNSLIESKKTQLPKEVLNYVKQNPELVIEKLMESFGDKFYDIVGETYSKKKRVI